MPSHSLFYYTYEAWLVEANRTCGRGHAHSAREPVDGAAETGENARPQRTRRLLLAVFVLGAATLEIEIELLREHLIEHVIDRCAQGGSAAKLFAFELFERPVDLGVISTHHHPPR